VANHQYDAIVVGGRCAGSPTAMLLARRGYDVLLVDRATFPSDTISTHLVHPPGVAALRRWGLLGRLLSTGCPAIGRYAFDMGRFTIAGHPGTPDEPMAYAPRRTVLDKLLLDAAAEAGAEVREGFTVDEIVFDEGRSIGIRGHDHAGTMVTERARMLVGADGLHSTVARAVAPEQYNQRPQLQAGYYAYFSGVPLHNTFEAYDRGNRAFAAWPTHDDLTLVIVSWPFAEFDANRRDIETHFHEAIARAPAFDERLRAGTRQTRFVGTAVPNFFRKPFGPGWVLVGDAGYTRDFITAQGISDAFIDAESCASALDDTLSGRSPADEALRRYQAGRDTRVIPMFEFTCQFAMLTPPPPEMQQLLTAVHGSQEAMDGFAQVMSGVVSPADFFSPQNVERILTADRQRN
jgi:2-polyprenyl-6-methoxyphenol hydroxylase-like FAD-dependent oxidoreductase